MFGDAYIDDVLVPNPYLMSENQFKLVMVEICNVRNIEFLEKLFREISGKSHIKVNIVIIFESIVFLFNNCEFESKMYCMFDIWSNVNTEKSSLLDNFLTFLDGLFRFYFQIYENSKKNIYKMGYGVSRSVKISGFQDYCIENPEALDILCRLTLGPYDPDNSKKPKQSLLDDSNRSSPNSYIHKDKNSILNGKKYDNMIKEVDEDHYNENLDDESYSPNQYNDKNETMIVEEKPNRPFYEDYNHNKPDLTNKYKVSKSIIQPDISYELDGISSLDPPVKYTLDNKWGNK